MTNSSWDINTFFMWDVNGLTRVTQITIHATFSRIGYNTDNHIEFPLVLAKKRNLVMNQKDRVRIWHQIHGPKPALSQQFLLVVVWVCVGVWNVFLTHFGPLIQMNHCMYHTAHLNVLTNHAQTSRATVYIFDWLLVIQKFGQIPNLDIDFFFTYHTQS